MPPPLADNTPLLIDNPAPTLIPPKVVLDAVGNVYAEGMFNADLKLAKDTLLITLSVLFIYTEDIDVPAASSSCSV